MYRTMIARALVLLCAVVGAWVIVLGIVTTLWVYFTN